MQVCLIMELDADRARRDRSRSEAGGGGRREGAHAEDSAIFNGLAGGGHQSDHPGQPPRAAQAAGRTCASCRARSWPRARRCARRGSSGPYALALAAPIYAQVLAAAEDGYPLAKRLTQQVLDGPLVRAPAIEGGVLLSLRGGDYELHVGQDLSIGYAAHDRQIVELYLTESFTFRTLEPAAAVALAALSSCAQRLAGCARLFRARRCRRAPCAPSTSSSPSGRRRIS